jgi:ribonuclease HII
MDDKRSFKLEKKLLQEGYRLICGVDEAGRGCLCGPVVAGACILDPTRIPEGIKDSKKLTAARREVLFQEITATALAWQIGIIEPDIIDEINILEATKLAMHKSIANLSQKPDIVLIDALKINDLQIAQKSYIKGDEEVVSIGAASIIAKVSRDRIMADYHNHFPQYNLKSNKGYPTSEHREAIIRFGPSAIHRKTFKGVIRH